MNRVLKARIVEMYGTQVDFAQAIDTDETIVSRVVRGRRELDTLRQNQWAMALDCRKEDIFGNGPRGSQVPTKQTGKGADYDIT